MNLAEVHSLLELAQTFDNRRFDDTTVVAWHAVVGDLGHADCAAAIVEHFRTTDAYLMPVHIRRGAAGNAHRRDGAARALQLAEQLALPAAPEPPLTEERRAELLAAIPPGMPNVLRRKEWVEWEREQERARRGEQEPNRLFSGFPPPGGRPVPGDAA
jgi:hypothetical protein